MKVCVTGGNGFIGKRIVSDLLDNGHEVIVYDLPTYNLLNERQMEDAIKQCDLTVHCAAMANVVECFVKLDETFDTNIRGTYNVAKFCAKHDKHMTFISTCCVYGNSLDGTEIEFKTAPMCNEPYATSKVAGEAIVRGIPNLKWTILRIGTVYGVGMREALFTYIALDGVKNGKKIYIDGDGKQDRQLIYIDDLIDGISKAIHKHKDCENEIFNLCGVEKTSAMETVAAAIIIVGKDVILEHRAQRYGQTMHENISIERAKQLLHWEPKTKFHDGMKFTYENDIRFR